LKSSIGTKEDFLMTILTTVIQFGGINWFKTNGSWSGIVQVYGIGIFEKEGRELIEPRIFSGGKGIIGRIHASCQFAGDVLRVNKLAVSKPIQDYKPNLADNIASYTGVKYLAEALKYPFVYLFSVNSFLLGMLSLKYSDKYKGYI
jgi:hypothetical protein